MSEPQILDTPFTGDSTSYNALDHLAGNGKRFLNFIIDMVVYYLLSFVAGYILAITGNASIAVSPIPAYLIAFTILVGYYLVMESTTGATLGKMITKTKVVTQNGEKPTTGQFVGRSFARLIPFEAFSFLGGNPGWHDTMTSTFVVNKEG
jgi:uncharacterized RDD family membrane protein YckC